MNSLNFYLKKLEKEKQDKSKTSIRREIIERRPGINETENRKTVEKTSKTKSQFFEKIKKKKKGHFFSQTDQE